MGFWTKIIFKTIYVQFFISAFTAISFAFFGGSIIPIAIFKPESAILMFCFIFYTFILLYWR